MACLPSQQFVKGLTASLELALQCSERARLTTTLCEIMVMCVVVMQGEAHGDATLILGDGRHPLSDVVCPMYASPSQCRDLGTNENRHVNVCTTSLAGVGVCSINI
eukprot:4039431-Amphidinium_carterae.3